MSADVLLLIPLCVIGFGAVIADIVDLCRDGGAS